ncbi:hypothetical protein B0I35DRAFT_435367 [Stachybotrys elegans]|uniref:Transcription initiation factor TFIID subunit 2 n=1 Tax=Stachybotrys elegans TaxID=80388 RepID=A0A8K0SNC9_9HYPO|nr:hypothetical protein B0I35DRAFT_435367 [Stachybotrys elegans]
MAPDDSPAQHALLGSSDDLPPIQDRPISDYFVLKQEVNAEVSFRHKRIYGTTDIYIAVFSEKVEEIALDAAQCDIDTDKITISEVREVQGELVEGPKRSAMAQYNDPYKKLSHPKGWNWRAEHHDLRRIRARHVFHSRRTDVPAENREFEGCTPVYGSLRVMLRGKGEQERPRLIIRKSTLNPDQTDKTPSHKQYKITVPFDNVNPRDGLHFVGVDHLDTRYTHMYTRHSIQPGTASCIFPCIDDHGSRCDWRISIKYPRTLGDALDQALATQQNDDKMQLDGPDRPLHLAEEDKLREMSVVCSGFLMEETVDPENDHKKIMVFEPEKKASIQKLGFAIGPFEHIDLSSEFRTEEDEVKLGMSALKVHAYCLPNRGDEVRNTAMALTMAADFFTYTFAKYPFGNFKLCFLDDMVEETAALHSLAFISSRLLFPEDIIDTEPEATRKLVYTLASQWIGVNMIPNTRNDLWLVMGIAHYMTDLFMKRLCGNNEYRFRMKIMSDKLVQVDVDRPALYDLGPFLHLGQFEMDFMALKAPIVLFILDKRLAKASGGHGLTRILQKLLTKVQIEGGDKSTILETEKFKVICEKSAKYRLESFWNQWVYAGGCPRFDVKAKFNKKRLCVELTLNQVQIQDAKSPPLDRENFLRMVKERRAGVALAEVQPLFTGPMTIRIHEADGTPYEHILEIREDATRSTKFEIPYNTKYKRLKRTRRMKEKHNAGVSMEAVENADDTLLYCLGDVLQSPEDREEWELIDWDPDTERKMDQESYEWIRIDADFEWACDMKRTLEPYMYVSQLQQDRDVVAQQDAILYLSQAALHPIASGFLVRTLVDRRYFHGIRTMAAEGLPRQSNIKDIPMLGLRQLMKAFREMFCFPDSNQPRPNDFSDKRQYKVRCAIIKAIAEVRDSSTHRCPLEARQFILDQLLFNNNEKNIYSDHFYIALLVEALATSLIPSQEDDWYARQNKMPNEEERVFLEQAMEQIERVLRRDEWTNSYQNIWTVTGLDAKQRLMKAEVIPKSLTDFAQYLLDGTRDLVRIKCFESLVALDAMMDPSVFSFLTYVLMTDRSPFVRSKLTQVLASGLAAIAFGEHTKAVAKEPQPEEADPLLVQDSALEIEARKEAFARKENLDVALAALRREMEDTYGVDERHYSTAMRKALDHDGLGRAEIDDLLDIAAMMFEEARTWVLTLNLPKGWKAQREKPTQQLANQLLMKFKSYYRTTPKVPIVASMPPPEPKPAPPPISRTPSIKITTKPPIPHRTPLPTPATVEPAVTSSVNKTPLSKPVLNKPVLNKPVLSKPVVSKPILSSKPVSSKPLPSGSSFKSNDTPSNGSIKRPRPDKEEGATPAPKRPKTDSVFDGEIPRKKRRMVTMKVNRKRLRVILGHEPRIKSEGSPFRTALPSSIPKSGSPSSVRDTIMAKPARKPLPSSDQVRRPLPGGSSASPPTPSPNVNKNLSKLDTGSRPASPAPSTPGSAAPRPKIKIIRKPHPPPAS